MKDDFAGLPMVLTEPCKRNGCKELALVAPKLQIPVRGYPQLEPFSVVIDLPLCRAHFRALKPQDFLSKFVRGGAKHVMCLAGVEPDFTSARFTECHIMSSEFRRFRREIAEGARPGETVAWDANKFL